MSASARRSRCQTVGVGERLEHEHAARESSAALTSNEGFSVVAPIRVMVAVLDVGQDGVLLGLVEAVDLVDEEDRASAGRAQRASASSTTLRRSATPAMHGAEGDEARVRACARSPREGGLAGAGRTPQDHRGDASRIDAARSSAPGPSSCILADELVERARAHAGGERLRGERSDGIVAGCGARRTTLQVVDVGGRSISPKRDACCLSSLIAAHPLCSTFDQSFSV